MAIHYQNHKIEKHFEKILLRMSQKKAKGMTTYMSKLIVSKLKGEIAKRVYGRQTKYPSDRTWDFFRSVKRTKTEGNGSTFYSRIFFDSSELTNSGTGSSGFNNHFSKYGSEKWGYSRGEKVRAGDLAMWLDQGYRVAIKNKVIERPPSYFMDATIKAKDRLWAELQSQALNDKMLANLERSDVFLPEDFGGSSYEAFYGSGDSDIGEYEDEY